MYHDHWAEVSAGSVRPAVLYTAIYLLTGLAANLGLQWACLGRGKVCVEGPSIGPPAQRVKNSSRIEGNAHAQLTACQMASSPKLIFLKVPHRRRHRSAPGAGHGRAVRCPERVAEPGAAPVRLAGAHFLLLGVHGGAGPTLPPTQRLLPGLGRILDVLAAADAARVEAEHQGQPDGGRSCAAAGVGVGVGRGREGDEGGAGALGARAGMVGEGKFGHHKTLTIHCILARTVSSSC